MIRKALLSDIDDINKLLYQVHKVHSDKRSDIFRPGAKKYNSEELAGIFANDMTPIYVYTNCDDKVIGYAFCILNDYNDSSLTKRRELYIDDLCVDEAHRGKGIGKNLYKYVCEMSKELNVYHVTLNVWCLNDGAMAFYKSLGLKPLKIYMEHIID